MGANLYFMSGGQAVEMGEYRYDSEDILQKIIADNPNLLLRDIDPEDSRLMLVAREFRMAEGDDSSNAYFLDHLLIDQNGVPVLVEVKRSSDTRVRREVVTQMLDYASRASAWNPDELRKQFRSSNQDDEELLAEYDTDEFWSQTATFLKAEQMKLVFAADRIPNPLKILIEFLNRNMENIEVYGVELRQYRNEGAVILASSVIGETTPKTKRAASSSVEWDAASYSAKLLAWGMSDRIPIVEELQNYAKSIGLNCYSGRGAKCPSIIAKYDGRTVFNVGAWHMKSKGHVCTIGFRIPDLLHYLPEGWNEEQLRLMLTNFPEKEAGYAKGLIWNPPQKLYIELKNLQDSKNMAAFKQIIKKLYTLISNEKMKEFTSPK